MDPTDTDGRRRTRARRWAVAGVAAGTAIAATAGGIALSRMGSSAPPPTACSIPTAPPASGVTAPATQAPGGGGLRVVEKGFTQIGGPHGRTVSMGAVLENTGNHVAYRSRIAFQVFDARGRTTVPTPTEPNDRPGSFPDPGNPGRPARAAHRRGRVDLRARRHRPWQAVTVARFEIDLGDTHWFPPDTVGPIFARTTTRHERTERSTVEEETGTVRYTIDSGYCRTLPRRGAAMVFATTLARSLVARSM